MSYCKSEYLWAWSDPAACQRPAPWCQSWHPRWWPGSRCTASLCYRLPPAPQTGRTQPDVISPAITKGNFVFTVITIIGGQLLYLFDKNDPNKLHSLFYFEPDFVLSLKSAASSPPQQLVTNDKCVSEYQPQDDQN